MKQSTTDTLIGLGVISGMCISTFLCILALLNFLFNGPISYPPQ